MKKKITNIPFYVFLVVLLFGIFSTSVYADTDSFDSEEKINQFLDNASVVKASSSSITLKKSDIIDEHYNANGEKETSMKDTIVELFFPDNDAADALLKLENLSRSNNNREIWDGSGQVKLYSYVYYDQTMYNGYLYVKFTSAAGGISAGGNGDYVNSGVYVTSNYVNYGIFGENRSGSTVNYSNQRIWSNSSRNWSISIPSPDYIKVTDSAFSGVTYFVRLSRGNNTWPTQLENLCF